MRAWLAIWLCGVLLAAAAGCAREHPPHRETFPALGTLVTIEIHDCEPARAAAAVRAVEDYLQRIGGDWYAWGDGELGQINAALARGASAQVSTELAELLKRSVEMRTLSDGYFDPTVGMLVELWGLNRADRDGEPPSEAMLDQWSAGMAARANLTIADGMVSARTPLKLDLGGIAKGTALAGALHILRGLGVNNALIDAGGDLQVAGLRGERHWRVGIRNPRAPEVLATVELLPGEAIVTSGDYERYFEYNGTRYHHLLDPKTGRPVTHTSGASVISMDPELADAAATALMAAGPNNFAALTQRMGISLALLVTSDGELMTTAAMRIRLDKTSTPSMP